MERGELLRAQPSAFAEGARILGLALEAHQRKSDWHI